MSEKVIKQKQELKDHWFWSSVLENKATYSQIVLASLFINIFGLGGIAFVGIKGPKYIE